MLVHYMPASTSLIGLSNGAFKSYEDIVDLCCKTTNKLVNPPFPSVYATGRISGDHPKLVEMPWA